MKNNGFIKLIKRIFKDNMKSLKIKGFHIKVYNKRECFAISLFFRKARLDTFHFMGYNLMNIFNAWDKAYSTILEGKNVCQRLDQM